jgi:subtilisin family serine protease
MYKTYGYINQNQLVLHLGSSNPNQAGSAAISYAKKALGVTSVASTNNAGEEQLTDKNGAVWIYGKADAPDCINGKMVFASGTSKAGKPYKGWFDPMKGPKPMRKPEGYTPVDPIFLK